MKQSLREQLRGMTAAEMVEMALWTALAVVVPLSWRLSIWLLTALVAYGIVKAIACRQQVAKRPRSMILTLCMPMLLFAVLLVSMAYSDNQASGWQMLFRKLALVTLPVYFLIANPRWMSAERIRLLMHALVLSCTGYFMFYLGYHLLPILLGQAGSTSLFHAQPLVEHHTYAAMYFLLALSFIYHHLMHFGATLSTAEKWLMSFSALCMVAFLVFISSRAGIVCLVALSGVALFNITFRRRHYLVGLLLTLLAVGAFVGTVSLLGDAQRRLTTTIKQTATEGQKDIRFDLLHISMEAVGEHWLAGVGVGDRDSVLLAKHGDFARRGLSARGSGLNSHNEYLDSWIAAGLPGLIACLLLFIVPAVVFRRAAPHNGPLLALLLIASLTSLFESILGRQMGLLFFIAFYCLLTRYATLSPALQAATGDGSAPQNP